MGRPKVIIEEDEADDLSLELGNPSSIDLAPELGATPLPNPRWERFLEAVYRGEDQSAAYRQHVATKPDIKDTTVYTESSKLMKRPEVQARFQYLVKSREENSGVDSPTGAGSDPASRREAIIQATRIIRGGKNVSAMVKLQAIDRLTKINQWDKMAPEDQTKKHPDPAFFAAYIQRMRLQLQAKPASS